ncbi:P-loop containing nucleoside triphosphate hydrolase protein [Thozetella sp. PMI_491]|nr:P-loop containing nucleoside triphosphate hydrolase protein [Thozetella sp. PMI_491]
MSFVWTDEEADYLKAVLRWQDAPEEAKRKLAVDAERRKKTAGEFRILVIGAKGTGKTSILTRRGCRHTVSIEGQFYMVDALEMPSQHLSSNPMLEQALNITEAAVLVYDVRDAETLKLAKGIAEFMQDSVSGRREYGLMLVGNKSDADDEEREVPWAEGSKAASTFMVPSSGTQFIEVSAKTGDNIDRIFIELGKDVLKIKRLNQQRREQVEKAKAQIVAPISKRRLGFWKTLATPFFKRGVASPS